MKHSLFIMVLIFFTANTFANDPCEKIVSNAVKLEVKNHREDYRRFRVESVECKIAPNEKVLLCEALGSNGDGAGDMSFLVVVSKTCQKVYDVRLTGEE